MFVFYASKLRLRLGGTPLCSIWSFVARICFKVKHVRMRTTYSRWFHTLFLASKQFIRHFSDSHTPVIDAKTHSHSCCRLFFFFFFKCYRCNHLALENQPIFFSSRGVQRSGCWRWRRTFIVVVVWSARTSIVKWARAHPFDGRETREKYRKKKKMNVRFISFGRRKSSVAELPLSSLTPTYAK